MRLSDISADSDVRDIIRRALKEDVGSGDITSVALVEKNVKARAVIIARDRYVVSGTKIAREVFRQVDRGLKCEIKTADGSVAKKGAVIMAITGRVRSILTAERTALNFLQRMTGVATLTSMFSARTRQYGVVILDTRKTTPTLRKLEKYAVLCGGGSNHRMGLFDRILIKDNHRKIWSSCKYRELDEAVHLARARFPGKKVEVEVESLKELKEALKARPDWVLLDNMKTGLMKKCVDECRGRTLVEASGGITLRNIQEVAKTGVDAVSIGSLTHSAPAADLSLELE